MAVEYPNNWKDISAFIKQRDDYTCAECGRKYPPFSTFLHVHHKIPLSLGGDNSANNLITLCRDCHCDRHEHMPSFNNKAKRYKSNYRKYKYKPLKR